MTTVEQAPRFGASEHHAMPHCVPLSRKIRTYVPCNVTAHAGQSGGVVESELTLTDC
jgi:hypothetical protein